MIIQSLTEYLKKKKSEKKLNTEFSENRMALDKNH